MRLHRLLYVVTALALTFSLPAQAAEASHARLPPGTADASFSTVYGCEDDLVGVTVTGGASPQVAVFGTFAENCEFGTSTSFYGTAPLSPGEYAQDGVRGAKLTKTLEADGHEVEISLTWTGQGPTTAVRTEVKGGRCSSRGRQTTLTRDATATGTFSVDGLGRISGTTLTSASLVSVR